MASALEVARFLIRLAAPRDDEDADCLCHMRMQKLLYYVQGWHLAACGTPLFEGRIEAWKHGPVVREIYPVFRDFGYQALPPKEGEDSPNLSLKEKEFVRSIWEEYKKYSATALREMTHQEGPWLAARGNAGPEERCDAEITHGSMRAFFLPLLDDWLSRCDPRINKALWARSRQDIESGRAHTTREIRGGIRSHRAGLDSQ
jgi:uncharacterized phage-associated protein